MKLYYRGLSYEYDPNKVASKKIEQPFEPVPQVGSAYNLIYRGVTYRIDPSSKSAEIPQTSLAYKLSFRGIIYFVIKTAQEKVTIASQPATTSKVAALAIFEELKLQ